METNPTLAAEVKHECPEAGDDKKDKCRDKKEIAGIQLYMIHNHIKFVSVCHELVTRMLTISRGWPRKETQRVSIRRDEDVLPDKTENQALDMADLLVER